MDRFLSEAETYPELMRLRVLIEQHQFTFAPLDDTSSRREISWRTIEVTDGKTKINIPVDDEYRDVDTACPELLLNIILLGWDLWREVSNFEEWCRELGAQNYLAEHQIIYNELLQIDAQLSNWFGAAKAPANDYEMSLNSGAAQALRRVGNRG